MITLGNLENCSTIPFTVKFSMMYHAQLYHMLATLVRDSSCNILRLFSTVVPAIIFMFLSCRPFVAITTLSTGLVSVEVTSVSWLGQLTERKAYRTET